MYKRNPDDDLRALEQQVKQSKDPNLALELFYQKVRRGEFSELLVFPRSRIEIAGGFFLISCPGKNILRLAEDTLRILEQQNASGDPFVGLIFINDTYYRLVEKNSVEDLRRYASFKRPKHYNKGILTSEGSWVANEPMNTSGLVAVNQAEGATTPAQRLGDWRDFIRGATPVIRRWAGENHHMVGIGDHTARYNQVVRQRHSLEAVRRQLESEEAFLAEEMLRLINPNDYP